MSRFFTQEGLKCPYCDEKFPTHRALRVHVGAKHREKTDDFMDEYFGGRWIEADFVALMLQSAMGEITEEYIQLSGNDVGCPIYKIHEDLAPYQIAVNVKQDKVKELLRSDIIWTCTSCLACEMDFRAYDPCFACATHSLPGRMPLAVEVLDSCGNLLQRLERNLV